MNKVCISTSQSCNLQTWVAIILLIICNRKQYQKPTKTCTVCERKFNNNNNNVMIVFLLQCRHLRFWSTLCLLTAGLHQQMRSTDVSLQFLSQWWALINTFGQWTALLMGGNFRYGSQRYKNVCTTDLLMCLLLPWWSVNSWPHCPMNISRKQSIFFLNFTNDINCFKLLSECQDWFSTS